MNWKLPRMSPQLALVGKLTLSFIAVFAMTICAFEVGQSNGRSILALISFALICILWIWMIRLTPEEDRMEGACTCPRDERYGHIKEFKFECTVHGPAMRSELRRAIEIVDNTSITNEVIQDQTTWTMCKNLIRRNLEHRGR